MTTPETTPAPKTRHRIHEVPGQTAPVGKPAGKPAEPKKTAKAPKVAAKPKKAQAAGVPAPKAPSVSPQSKQDAVIALLKRDEGATIAQITEATGWQAHSIRGFFAGTLKKRKGVHVASRKGDGEARVYFIDPTPQAPAEGAAEAPEAV